MRQPFAAVSSESRAATIEPLEHRVLFSRALGVDVSSFQGTINWTAGDIYIGSWTGPGAVLENAGTFNGVATGNLSVNNYGEGSNEGRILNDAGDRDGALLRTETLRNVNYLQFADQTISIELPGVSLSGGRK